MAILTRLNPRPKADTDTTVAPAHDALQANRARTEKYQREIDRLVTLDTQVLAARADAQALVDKPAALRDQLAKAEVAALVARELDDGAVVDAVLVPDLRIELREAERQAAPATTRVAVEDAKHERLQSQIATARAAQSQEQAQHTALAVECLWERLSVQAAALTAARAAYLKAFDEAFSVARAIDRQAEAMKTGRFANSGTAGALCLPTVAGMEELPYSQHEHLTRIEAAAAEILRGVLA